MKKASILVLALVLILGSLGVGFAYWTQAMTINGTVNTGFISANFYDASLEVRPYSTSSWEVPVTGRTDPSGAPLKDVLTLTINDAYPGYHQEISFRVINNGTVPFWLDNIKLADVLVFDGDTAKITDIINVPEPEQQFSLIVVEPGAVSGWYTFMITIPGVAEGSGNWVDPEQYHTYYVTIPLIAIQSMVI